jgi:hypothetical protein
MVEPQCEFSFQANCSLLLNPERGFKVEEPVPDSLSFKQLSMAWIETCLRNVWGLKIKSVIGPLSVIGASTLESIQVLFSDGG